MAYEVDIHAVGDESHSGDAITLRFGNFIQNPADQTVVVIDGGFQDSGEKIVNRIKNEYGTNRADVVILTHPDNDHVSGLHVVLEELEVGELWMHTPWHTSSTIKKLAEDNRIQTTLGLSNKLKKSLEKAYDLEKLAISKGVKIVDPFQGHSAYGNILHILGPSHDFYHKLAGDFEKSATISGLLQKAKSLISEVWHKDELLDPAEDAVSARNNSSVVLLANLDDQHFLFTGDAGVTALNHAADYATAAGFDLATKIHYQQVPHHGSKRNVGPSVLNRIIGPILPEGQLIQKTAFISASAKGHPKHPSPKVKNALIRRGVKVSATCGSNHCFRSTDVPMRAGWGPIKHEDFTHSYEEEE